MIRHLMAT